MSEEASGYVEAKKAVDLAAFSKKDLVSLVEQDHDSIKRILHLTEEDYKKAESFSMKLFGFEESGFFKPEELRALLVKFIPEQLLTQRQHIKGVLYEDRIMIPQLNDKSMLADEVEVAFSGNNEFIRTLCIKKHEEPWLKVFSPKGLHHNNDVLKVVLLNGILHDFGHGVIDWYFEKFGEHDDLSGYGPFNEWILELGVSFGFGIPLTEKSKGYLVDEVAAGKAKSREELAQIGIE